MRNQDTFSKNLYVVVWAGCTIPLSGRSFDNEEEAIEMFKVWIDQPGIRIERMMAAFVFDTLFTKTTFEKYIDENNRKSGS